jgi:DNA polymerase III subunit gamma/tau
VKSGVESLALKYRPTDFTDLVGQRPVNIVLEQMIKTGKIPAALLFSGSRGTGKTTTARIFAAAVNCENQPGPCGCCPSCRAVSEGTSAALLEIDAASNGLVEDMRALREQLRYATVGRYRVVVLDEAHSMSTAAFNVLLKTLEEPPGATVFILATTEPGKILDTVASRCMVFKFSRISINAITERLVYIAAMENIDIEGDLLRLLAQRADGALRDAIMSLDQIASVGIRTVEAYELLMGESDIGAVLLTSMVGGNHALAYRTLDGLIGNCADIGVVSTSLIGVLKDLLILHAGGSLTRAGQELETRLRLKDLIPLALCFVCMNAMWEYKTKYAHLHTEDQRSGLELLVALLMEKFATVVSADRLPAPTVRRLSLTEMAAIR